MKFKHVAIICEDIDLVLQFYVDVFDMNVVKDIFLDSKEFSKGIGVKGAQARTVHLSLQDDDFILELTQYQESISSGVDSYANMFGIRHIAFSVEDIYSLWIKLEALGAELISEEPVFIKSSSESSGLYFGYCKDPEGNIIEFIEN
ncbi:VOC family protein [Photobacterium gaetbulicola]|uniref:VOC domain-containing protein n=1 Tax=Photobacterium gaetbulicola Gung47 TaxID=658445 RepID=A0A0C5WJN8_9GAMM|nr:VOC family protein [Photobacterium gaetbulicola]AJR05309.1 hypothetical protein H744_1c0284 [Photobacterium gaetbulicola Gung47]PSU02617.1 VOC family protein [Photobacterium gaetbulicola]